MKQGKGIYYTYILECADGTLYCGYTDDVERRVRVHGEGKGARYTRSRLPVRLVYCEAFSSKNEAMSREYRIKKLDRSQKLALIGAAKNSAEETQRKKS